ncbi:hypothetical protein [Roseomonas sp. BN140053]|uniref:FliH/SctL family protein n=1 Tax=Roseomonas sp. BN140053 TaxID=3391898 RepID=UPI0039EB26AF
MPQPAPLPFQAFTLGAARPAAMARPVLSGLALPDLDAAAAPPRPEGPTPEEVDLLLDVAREAALAEGRALGEAEGRAAALASSAALLNDILAEALNRIDEAAAEAAAAAEQNALSLGRLLLRMLDAALPGAAARAAPELLDQLVAQLGPVLEAPEGATVLVPPDLLDAAQERLAGSGLPVQPDPALAPGDARIAWRGGALALDLAQRRAAIHDILASLDLLENSP